MTFDEMAEALAKEIATSSAKKFMTVAPWDNMGTTLRSIYIYEAGIILDKMREREQQLRALIPSYNWHRIPNDTVPARAESREVRDARESLEYYEAKVERAKEVLQEALRAGSA